MTVPTIVHVATPDSWAQSLREGGLRDEPFLHLCTEDQLAFVLSRHFVGQEDLLVVTIDPAGLDIRWELSEPGMGPFPHLYGWAPVSAAMAVRPLRQRSRIGRN